MVKQKIDKKNLRGFVVLIIVANLTSKYRKLKNYFMRKRGNPFRK